ERLRDLRAARGRRVLAEEADRDVLLFGPCGAFQPGELRRTGRRDGDERRAVVDDELPHRTAGREEAGRVAVRVRVDLRLRVHRGRVRRTPRDVLCHVSPPPYGDGSRTMHAFVRPFDLEGFDVMRLKELSFLRAEWGRALALPLVWERHWSAFPDGVMRFVVTFLHVARQRACFGRNLFVAHQSVSPSILSAFLIGLPAAGTAVATQRTAFPPYFR